jgi:hypothetical protein
MGLRYRIPLYINSISTNTSTIFYQYVFKYDIADFLIAILYAWEAINQHL